jgi:DNA-binding transcriptional LysR family regulator
VELYQLRTFVTVAREQSITRAAEQLFLSQPAISAHIKAMEKELGFPLFDRTPKGMTTTADGQRILAKADAILASQKELIDEARRLKGRLGGRVSAGTIGNPSAKSIGILLGRLSERYPEIAVTLRHGTSGEILQAIRAGTVDVGYVFDLESDESIRTILIEEVGVYVAFPASWGEGIRTDNWEALAALPWICPAPNTFCGKVAEKLFETHGLRPQRIISADQGSVTRVLISGGVGVGLLHGDSALEAERLGEVVLWQGFPHGHGRLVLAYDGRREQEPLIKALIALAREISSEGSLAEPPPPRIP